MYLETKEDLSTIYLVKNLFSSVAGVKVVDDYPNENLTIPTIAVNAGKIRLEDFELGNRKGRRTRRWTIDIYAKNKAQRDEFGYRILNGFDDGIKVYNYDEGFPPSVSPSIEEHLNVLQRDMDFIKVMPQLVDKLYYRATVTIVATNDTV